MAGLRVAVPHGLAAAVGGAVLLVLGGWLAWSTERGERDYRALLQQHGGAVVDLGRAEFPPPGLQGQLVRVVGTPRVVVAPYDAEFNQQQAATPVLARRVEMFQWRELRLGGSVNYELDWVDKPVDASRFERPAGHANPGAFPLHSQSFMADSVNLGGYTLGAALVRALPGGEPVAADARALPANLAASFSPHDGKLVTSDQPGHPQLGDLRVSWRGVPLQEVTVIARVDGDRLVAVPDAADGRGFDVNVGDSALLDMRPDMAARPALPWLKRLLALLLAAAGAGLLWWRGTARRDPLAALGGGLLVAGAPAALAWLGGSLPAALGWLAAALAGAALLAWRGRGQARSR